MLDESSVESGDESSESLDDSIFQYTTPGESMKPSNDDSDSSASIVFSTASSAEEKKTTTVEHSKDEEKKSPISTPMCNRLSQYLNENGYSAMALLPSDVDAASMNISVYVIESFASTVLTAVEEMGERLLATQKAATNASMASRLHDVSREALEARITDLRAKLLYAEEKEKSQGMKMQLMTEELNEKNKSVKAEDKDMKRVTKNFDLRIQEAYRHTRQKEVEIDRLREKLRIVAEKEKDQNVRNQHVLHHLKTVGFNSANTSLLDISGSESSASGSVHGNSPLMQHTRSSRGKIASPPPATLISSHYSTATATRLVRNSQGDTSRSSSFHLAIYTPIYPYIPISYTRSTHLSSTAGCASSNGCRMQSYGYCVSPHWVRRIYERRRGREGYEMIK